MTTAPNSEREWAEAIVAARLVQERARREFEARQGIIDAARQNLINARHTINVLEEQFQAWLEARVQAEIEKVESAAGGGPTTADEPAARANPEERTDGR